MDAVLDGLLRLIGAFYVFAAVVGLRAAATTALLDQGLSALGAADAAETRAERERNAFLTAMLAVVGAGGALLVALLAPAVWVFCLAAVANAVYLHWLSPRRFDPYDPPEESGRSQTRNAYRIYVAATALVLAGWWSGRLTPLGDASALALGVGFGLVGALLATAVRLRLQARLGGASSAMPAVDDEEPLVAAPEASPWDDEDLEIVMRPSWRLGAFCDARTGRPIDVPVGAGYTIEDDAAVHAWLARYWAIADPDDPDRQRFLPGADIAAFEAQGRAIFEKLATAWAPRRLHYRPTPEAQRTQHDADAVKVMADVGCYALWVTSAGNTEPVSAHDFGLSWGLARDIFAWEDAFDARVDMDDPGASRPDDAAFAAAHDALGRQLAVRLARELAATGRGHVRVQAFRTGVGPYDVSARDPLDGDK